MNPCRTQRIHVCTSHWLPNLYIISIWQPLYRVNQSRLNEQNTQQGRGTDSGKLVNKWQKNGKKMEKRAGNSMEDSSLLRMGFNTSEN